ncbi:MAG: hypothetical protein LBV46_03930, partial [Bacteroidales bacterium]|nr:hypothetical protein [Bacteroidales bacterium]
MKKVLFLSLCLLLTLLTSQAQYQIINGGFEDWEGSGDSREPVRWNSFMTATGSYASQVSAKQIEESSDIRPGSIGHSSIRTWARRFTVIVVTITANGMFTTGQVNAAAMSASSTDNCNKTVIDNSNFNQPMIGKPDSLYFWAKAVFASSSQEARV